MKNLIYMLCCLLFIGSCNNDDNGLDPTSYPTAVSDIVATPDYGAILLSWKNPANADFSTTQIAYAINGQVHTLQVKKPGATKTIEGLSATDSYTFYVTSVNTKGYKSETLSVTASPKAPAHAVVIATVTVTPSINGAVIQWENVTGKEVTVTVNYTASDASAKVATKTSSLVSDQITINGLASVEQTVSLAISSGVAGGNSNKSLQVTPERPLEPVMLDKTAWEVVAQSSQETVGESPNGFASKIIDGDDLTYWHTIWYDGTPTLPNYVIIDMKKQISVYWVKVMERRTAGGSVYNNLKTVEILLSDDNVTYTKVATISKPATEIELEAPASGRYLKLNMPDSNNGSNCAMGEVYVKGIE